MPDEVRALCFGLWSSQTQVQATHFKSCVAGSCLPPRHLCGTDGELCSQVLLAKLGVLYMILPTSQLTQLGDVFHQCWQYSHCADAAYFLTKDQYHGMELWMREARVSVA